MSLTQGFVPVFVIRLSDRKATARTPGGTVIPRAARSAAPRTPHRAIDLDVEGRSGVIDEAHRLPERDAVRRPGYDLEGFLVERRRREPVLEVERHPRIEEDRELAALGAEPEAVLAAEGVDVGVVDL